MNIIGDLLESVPVYTREEFEVDHARVVAAICAKHGITEDEVPKLIREHRYEHTFDCPEDEWIEIMTFARHAGWDK